MSKSGTKTIKSQDTKALKKIDYKTFDPFRLEPEGLNDNYNNAMHLMSNVRYAFDEGSEIFMLQTPEFTIKERGVPAKLSADATPEQRVNFNKFYATVEKRHHCQIAEDLENPKCVEFFKRLEELDEYMSSPDFKNKLLGTEAKNFEYSPLIRDPREPTKKQKDGKVTKNNRFVTFKFNDDFATKKIKTQVYVNGVDMNCETIDDVTKYATFLGKVKMVLLPSKIFADKKFGTSQTGKSTPKTYGIKFKIVQIACKPYTGSGGMTLKSNQISDSDDDNEDNGQTSKQVIAKDKKQTVSTVDALENEEEDVEEVDDDVEEDPEAEVEEEEEEIPAPPPVKKQVAAVPASKAKTAAATTTTVKKSKN